MGCFRQKLIYFREWEKRKENFYYLLFMNSSVLHFQKFKKLRTKNK
jgi:hypothetical protein